METTDNDFKLMLKRIGVTTLLFAAIYGVYLLYPYIPKEVEKPTTITVSDTIIAHSKDALEFKVITSMQVTVDPTKMSEQDHYLYKNNSHRFIDRNLRLPIKDKIISDVQKKINFDKQDSVDVYLKDLRNEIDLAIIHVLYTGNHHETSSAIRVASYWFDINLDPVIGVIIANRKANIAKARLQRMEDVLNGKQKKR